MIAYNLNNKETDEGVKKIRGSAKYMYPLLLRACTAGKPVVRKTASAAHAISKSMKHTYIKCRHMLSSTSSIHNTLLIANYAEAPFVFLPPLVPRQTPPRVPLAFTLHAYSINESQPPRQNNAAAPKCISLISFFPCSTWPRAALADPVPPA